MLAANSNVVSGSERDLLRADLVKNWKQIIDPVEPFLEAVGARLSDQVKAFDRELSAFADYALNGQGKQLRPALVALSANVLGKPTEAHTTVAVIIEMVHLATLVHDDIMDEAEIRRGRLTLAATWGNEVAVLFGDCLFARALTLAASFPTPEICRAVAMATNTVCTGEILQTQRRRDFSLTQQQYFRVLEMKTAELFALSCELSAVLSHARPEHRAALRDFGTHFGIAYQVYDDCLDLFGTEASAGKSLGTDLAKGKLTLPLLLLLERAEPADRERIHGLVENWDIGSLPALTSLLSKYNALGGSLSIMRTYLNNAIHALEQLPATPGRGSLAALTDFLALQTDLLGSVPENSL